MAKGLVPHRVSVKQAKVYAVARRFHAASARLIAGIEAAGYAVSVHHMRKYVELHAVHLRGDRVPHVTRCEGDGKAELYQAARVLAGMVGVDIAD